MDERGGLGTGHRLTAAAIAALALAVMAVASPALAHTVKYRTTVTIDHATGSTGGGSDISGTVSSQNDKCEVGREVIVFDAGAPGGYLQIARTRSNRSGHWRTTASVLPVGEPIFAVVEARVRSRPGHLHVCKASKKGKATFPQP